MDRDHKNWFTNVTLLWLILLPSTSCMLNNILLPIGKEYIRGTVWCWVSLSWRLPLPGLLWSELSRPELCAWLPYHGLQRKWRINVCVQTFIWFVEAPSSVPGSHITVYNKNGALMFVYRLLSELSRPELCAWLPYHGLQRKWRINVCVQTFIWFVEAPALCLAPISRSTTKMVH